MNETGYTGYQLSTAIYIYKKKYETCAVERVQLPTHTHTTRGYTFKIKAIKCIVLVLYLYKKLFQPDMRKICRYTSASQSDRINFHNLVILYIYYIIEYAICTMYMIRIISSKQTVRSCWNGDRLICLLFLISN